MSRKEYYGERYGLVEPEEMSFETLKTGFNAIIEKLENDLYFHGATGYDCVDIGPTLGKWGSDFETAIYLDTRMNNVWPISDNIDDFDFGKTFSVIEYLFECVSKPGWTKLS